MVSPDSSEVSHGERFLLVRSGSSRFALPIASVTRVVRSVRTFPVPGSGPQLVGLLQLAGEPMPVLDLGIVVDGPGAGGGEHEIAVIVSVGRDQEVVGLAVNDAVTVLSIPAEAMSRSDGGFVTGEAVIDSTVIRVLDPMALGSPAA